jgi:lipoprotein-anchoring transpeptidase ErfK/SrfK
MKKALFLALFSLLGVAISLNFVFASESHAPQIKVFNSQTSHEDLYFMAYNEDFKGGARVARGDFNNDGYGDIAVGAGIGGGPHVKIFDKSGHEVWNAFPFASNFSGGVDVAAGDVDNDGRDDLIVGQFLNGQAWVKVYKVDDNKTILAEFLAYDENFQGGVRLSAGDIDGDNQDEIITGSGFGGGPQVKVFELDGRTIMNFAPFHPSFRGGVDVASGDINNDNLDEIAVSQHYFGQAWVKVYNSRGEVLSEFKAYPDDFQGGANISMADINDDNQDEIITGTGQNGGPQVRAFLYNGEALPINFMAYSGEFRGGVDVAGGDLDQGKVVEIVTAPGRIAFEMAKYDYPKYVEVTLSNQTLKYFEDGRKIDEYLISSGRTGPTPTGTFRIQRKLIATLMAGPGYYLPGVPYVMGFSGPYTIHGTYWHNNFGHPMSHGCVNMYTPEAKILYDWIDIGTPVIIHW